MQSKLKFLTGISLTVFLITFSGVQAQKHTIKFATLAPEGSTWMNVMREFDAELRKQTQGEVGFRIYAGGVLGDESDVLRKIRIGQLHAAGFTGLGLGKVSPEVHILEAPFLFRNYEEIDYIYEQFGDIFSNGFTEKGYELLGWAEVGFVYIFTKAPVTELDQLRKVKMWVWEGEPVAEATFKRFGVKPIPLSVLDVMTALQTKMIDGVYASPLAAIALQWFTKINYMMELPLSNAPGAILISQRMFQKIPEEYRTILKSLAQAYLTKLTKLSRKENEAAIQTLRDNGIQILALENPSTLNNYYQLGASTRKDLVGRFYSQDFLDKIEAALQTYRNQNGQ